jgi:hypothetical protein
MLISEDWGLERTPTSENAKLYRQLINPQLDCTKKQAAAQQITETFLEKITTDKQWLSELATFTSFWIYS